MDRHTQARTHACMICTIYMICVHACKNACMHFMHACMHIMHACISCMHACMHIMHACIPCMYACNTGGRCPPDPPPGGPRPLGPPGSSSVSSGSSGAMPQLELAPGHESRSPRLLAGDRCHGRDWNWNCPQPVHDDHQNQGNKTGGFQIR